MKTFLSRMLAYAYMLAILSSALVALGGCASRDTVTPLPNLPRVWDQGERDITVQECIDAVTSVGLDIGADTEVLHRLYWLCLSEKGSAI